MESLSNQNIYGDAQSRSNIELSLYGIETKWVRSKGSWVDKSKLPVIEISRFPSAESTSTVKSRGQWWKFWKA